MRHHIIRASVVACLVGGVSLAYAFSNGPVAARTGALPVGPLPGEGLCTVCHYSFEPNDPNGLLEILDVPETYVPDQVIPIRVRLRYAHDPADSIAPYKWGFQLTAVQANSGQGVGTFTIGPELKIVQTVMNSVWKTRRYVEHTNLSNHDDSPGPVEWTFQWTAPPGDSGSVYFFAAGNAADGSEDPFGDHIFTASETIATGGQVDVPRNYPPLQYSTILEPPMPNPADKCMDLSFSIARSGPMDLSVFDAQGRKIRTIFHEWRAAGPGQGFWDGRSDDGRLAANGIYFVRLRAAGETRPVSRKITVAH